MPWCTMASSSPGPSDRVGWMDWVDWGGALGAEARKFAAAGLRGHFPSRPDRLGLSGHHPRPPVGRASRKRFLERQEASHFQGFVLLQGG